MNRRPTCHRCGSRFPAASASGAATQADAPPRSRLRAKRSGPRGAEAAAGGGGGDEKNYKRKFLWNVFSQTMTVVLKPVALPEGVGIYSRPTQTLTALEYTTCGPERRGFGSVQIEGGNYGPLRKAPLE